MIKKRYKMFDVGSPYLTRCGVKSDDDYFENMTECCEEMNRLSEKNEQLNQEVREYIRALNKTLEEKEELWKKNEQLKHELYFWKKQAKQCPMRSCNE